MLNLELHLERTSSGLDPSQLHSDGVMYTFWHLVESVAIYSELNQWETVARWRQQYNLDFFKGHYFICLSAESQGVNNYNEDEAIPAKRHRAVTG